MPLSPLNFYIVVFHKNMLFLLTWKWNSLSHVQLFATPWTAAHQASLSITNSQSLLRLMSIMLVMPSNHLILCHPLLLTSIFPSIRVVSNKLAVHIRWPEYWRFSFSISPSNEYSGLTSYMIDWFDLLAVQGSKFCCSKLSRVLSNTTVQKHHFFGALNSLTFIGDTGKTIALTIWTFFWQNDLFAF